MIQLWLPDGTKRPGKGQIVKMKIKKMKVMNSTNPSKNNHTLPSPTMHVIIISFSYLMTYAEIKLHF
jgi:hypothetical protein